MCCSKQPHPAVQSSVDRLGCLTDHVLELMETADMVNGEYDDIDKLKAWNGIEL